MELRTYVSKGTAQVVASVERVDTGRVRVRLRKGAATAATVIASDAEAQALLAGLDAVLAPPPPPPVGDWPFQVPEPVLPTGLTRRTSYQPGSTDCEYVGLKIGTANGGKRVVYRDCEISYFGAGGGSEDVWVIGGSFGPMGDGNHSSISSGFSTSVAKRVVLDGVHIHGMHQGKVGDHTEGLQVGGVETLVIRNCLFEDNHVFNLFVRCWSPAPITNVLIEGNEFRPTGFFERPGDGTYSMRVAGDGDATVPTNVVIRGNRYPKGQPISVDRSVVNAVVEDNVPV